MIDTLFLANKIQEVLCQNQYGIDFLVFNDAGDLKTTKRIGAQTKKYVQCVLEKVSADTVPIKNIAFRVINTELTVFVDYLEMGYFETEGGRGQSKMLDVVQNILADNLYGLSGQTITLEDDGKTYNVTISMDEAITGEKTSLGELADMIPLTVSITFTIFENGINNNDIKIFINGEEIYFTRIVMSSVKTADQSTFANDKQSKVYMLMGGKSIDLTMPVLNTKFSKRLWEEYCGGEINKPVSFAMQTPLGNYTFVGLLGNTTITGDIGQNLGYNFSVVEGVEDVLDFNYQEWEKKSYEGKSFTITIDTDKQRVIQWGDGDFTITNAMGNYRHDYQKSGKYSIKIYKG